MNASVIPAKRLAAFTLVELMVSVSLLSLVALILVSMTNSTASTWRYTTGRIEQFRGANTAFEAITRRLSQATLNTYWDYEYPNNDKTKAPSKYIRQSDLRFIAGSMTVPVGVKKPLVETGSLRRPTQGIFFQAPLGFVDDTTNFGGLANLINTWGYYVEFNQDVRPKFIDDLPNGPPKRYRYRLMEFMQPSNALNIYSAIAANPSSKTWFTNALPTSAAAPAAGSPIHVLSENVVALVLMPKLSAKDEAATGTKLSKDYSYDSAPPVPRVSPQPITENQMPPIVQVTLVAIDETSASRIANGSSPPAFDGTLDTLFTDTTKFDADLAALQKTLQESKPPISYRVFTSNVSIRAAKWSTK